MAFKLKDRKKVFQTFLRSKVLKGKPVMVNLDKRYPYYE